MKAFEKAKLALRRHLLKNKDQVLIDLENMKSKSTGSNIYQYIDLVSNSFSFENVSISKEITYEVENCDLDSSSRLFTDLFKNIMYEPPNQNFKNLKNKKDSEISQSLFYFSSFTI